MADAGAEIDNEADRHSRIGGPERPHLDVSEPTFEPSEITLKVRAETVNQTVDVALCADNYARRPPLLHVPYRTCIRGRVGATDRG